MRLKNKLLRKNYQKSNKKYADPRQSEINLHDDLSIENEDLIPVEDVVITVTNNGILSE